MSEDDFGGLPVAPEGKQRRGRKPESAGAKVTVACNIPNGLRLRNFIMIPDRELVMGGGVRETTRAESAGEDIVINGTAVPFGNAPRHKIICGYALTEGVDKEAWDKWLVDNARSPMVLNRCIFAYDRVADAEDAAEEHQGTLSGLQPFQKDGDPRRPRRAANLSDITEADERAA